jgi:hypothetical protein
VAARDTSSRTGLANIGTMTVSYLWSGCGL